MKMTSRFKLILTMGIALLVTSINVSAQTVLPVQPVYSSVAAINKIVNGGALYSALSASGIANEFIRRASGQTLPVATSAATGVAASRIAGIAAGALKTASGIGLASFILPIIWDASGLSVCPAPDFICKIRPDIAPSSLPTYYSWGTGKFSSGLEACNLAMASITNYPLSYSIFYPSDNSCAFFYADNKWESRVGAYVTVSNTVRCPDGYITVSSTVCSPVKKTDTASETDISTKLAAKLADNTTAKNVYDFLAKNKVQVHSGNDVVVITAPAITAPADVSTSSINNPDGTTSTKVVSAVSTINPQQVGTTINNTTMSYPVTTITTTTITNNTTNEQTVTTNNETQKSPEVATPPEPKENDFCKLNPQLNICKNSSVSGQCKEISCVGDAIFCAVAKEAAESNCRAVKEKLDMETTAEFKLGRSVLSGVDPLSTSLPSVRRAAVVALPAFDSSGWLGGGSCFPDKTFSIQGKSVTIPFSTVCQYLVIFRYALMIVAMLVSFRILSGAIIRE